MYLIQICRIPWWCSLFRFSSGNTFLGKLGTKNQNCQVELKFRTRLIWICRKYAVFTFSVLDQENTFCTNLDEKKTKLSVKAEIWYQETFSNLQNSMTILTFSVFDWKYLFVQIWSKKIQILSLSSYFELRFCTRLIWIFRIM